MTAFGIALDTNILAYNVGVRRGEDDHFKVERVRLLLDALVEQAVLHVSNQALAELYNLLTKTALSRFEAVEQVQAVKAMATTTAITDAMMDDAFILAKAKRFQIFDAIIVSAARAAGVRILLSEDMQHGSTWTPTTILNPFKPDFDDYFERLTGDE